MRRSILAGACLLAAVSVAPAQPLPAPAPKPKTGIAPPAAVSDKPVAPTQSAANNLFPFKFPGFGSSGTTGTFDAGQRALIERVNVYLMSVQNLVGDFVQVGPDGRRSEGKIYLSKPGRVRFEYKPPSPIELVSDGNSVVIRDRKLD